MATIKIDEKDYDTEDMSQEALNQVQAIQYTQNELVRIQLQAAALQTAKNAYSNALKSLLEKGESTEDDTMIDLPDDLNFD
jgi:hypothetical protein